MEHKLKYLILFTLILFVFSVCSKKKNEIINNGFKIVKNKDTLENGFWKYDKSKNGVSKEGNYINGYKLGKWIYVFEMDTVNINWKVFDSLNVKFNVPDILESNNNIAYPVIYQGDINDNDNNTYGAFLRYDLKELNSSIEVYLYDANKYLKVDKNIGLISKDFKKYTFKNDFIVYKIETITKPNDGKIYSSISYVFQVKDYLYDLSYKNLKNGIDKISLEVFNDILYSLNCNGVDIFNNFNKKYLNEESVIFKNY